jgi:hypothetical protein
LKDKGKDESLLVYIFDRRTGVGWCPIGLVKFYAMPEKSFNISER